MLAERIGISDNQRKRKPLFRENMSEQTKAASDAEKQQDDTKVHSANSWETADLGDDDRKQKFLRLMGASKKEHKGRIVIGDHDPVHGRTKNDAAKISDDLEGQYEQGMEHRRLGGRRGHLGLGFHEGQTTEENKETREKDAETGETKKTEEETPDSEKRKHSDDNSPDDKNSDDKNSDDKNPDDKNPDDNPDESPTKKMKLNFVKAS